MKTYFVLITLHIILLLFIALLTPTNNLIGFLLKNTHIDFCFTQEVSCLGQFSPHYLVLALSHLDQRTRLCPESTTGWGGGVKHVCTTSGLCLHRPTGCYLYLNSASSCLFNCHRRNGGRQLVVLLLHSITYTSPI